MEIIQAYFTNHPCMGRKKREIHPVGILVHSTGSVNRELRRYVDEPERLGKNLYNNHWNKAISTKSVHAFIGYDKDKQVIVAETLPHDVACWGCGGGKKGSYNYDPHAYIQFEICQGSTSDLAYYWEAIKVAEEYCAHLCRIYGWTADNITSHAEAHRAGYASNHGDPGSWMRAFGDDMDKFRARVRARLGETDDGKEEEPMTEPINNTVDKLPTLRKGDSGEAVKRMQLALQAAGYDVALDGLYGTQTVSAVRAFQFDHGLTADGICGPATWAALNQAKEAVDKPEDNQPQDARAELVAQMRACLGRIQQEMVQMAALIEAADAIGGDSVG